MFNNEFKQLLTEKQITHVVLFGVEVQREIYFKLENIIILIRIFKFKRRMFASYRQLLI